MKQDDHKWQALIANTTEQVLGFNTAQDKRSTNKKVVRLLYALAIELKDLPYEKQMALDLIVNDLRDGYKFDWLGATETSRRFIKGWDND